MIDLIQHTTSRLPHFSKGEVDIEPLEKGGSDRKFYRMQIGDRSLILVHYGEGREENRHYVEIAHFLNSTGVHVPEIYFHDENERLIWMQDLGDGDLWAQRDQPWEIRRGLYRDVLDEVLVLHTKAFEALPDSGVTLQAEFNAPLYLWEQDYFFDNCMDRHFGMHDGIDRTPLNEIATRLALQPRVLVHRDFQSQNILIHEEIPYFIDFQGLRPGLAQYDLASLLFDPYVKISAPERSELLEYYINRSIDEGINLPHDFNEIFLQCAMQRLMQALGAYGFLGHVKKRPQFLLHIPAALASLKEVASVIPEAQSLSLLLENL
jgi:aminoglycoside/choline kinase family phosphotransferase